MSANDGLLPLLICGHLHNGKVVGKKKVRPSDWRTPVHPRHQGC
jgi:hypothetical protein